MPENTTRLWFLFKTVTRLCFFLQVNFFFFKSIKKSLFPSDEFFDDAANQLAASFVFYADTTQKESPAVARRS